MEQRASEFSHQVTLGVMKRLESRYSIALRAEGDVIGTSGELYDRETGSRYFQMEANATSDEMELFTDGDRLAAHYAEHCATDFEAGLKAQGAKPGDVLMVWASPKRPPVLVTPGSIGTVVIIVRFVVALPIRLPLGLRSVE